MHVRGRGTVRWEVKGPCSVGWDPVSRQTVSELTVGEPLPGAHGGMGCAREPRSARPRSSSLTPDLGLSTSPRFLVSRWEEERKGKDPHLTA